jgi:hypothetical protein
MDIPMVNHTVMMLVIMVIVMVVIATTVDKIMAIVTRDMVTVVARMVNLTKLVLICKVMRKAWNI